MSTPMTNQSETGQSPGNGADPGQPEATTPQAENNEQVAAPEQQPNTEDNGVPPTNSSEPNRAFKLRIMRLSRQQRRRPVDSMVRPQ